MRAFLSLAAIILLFCASCKKDKNNNNNTINNTDKLLHSFKIASGADSIRYNYSYNSQNKISTSHAYQYETGVLIGEVVFTFNYSGADTVFSSVSSQYIDHITPSTENDVEYFTLDNTGKLVKDSINSTSSSGMNYNFDYFSDHFQVITNFQDTVITQQTITNGNIVAEHDTINGPFIVDFSVHYTATFDNHPNPFYNTGIRRVLLFMPENFLQDAESPTPVFKNNPTEVSTVSTGSPNGNSHFQYSYTYDSDGYPVTATVNDIGDGVVYSATYYY